MKMRCFFVCIRILYHVKVVTPFSTLFNDIQSDRTSIKQRQIDPLYGLQCTVQYTHNLALYMCSVDRFYVEILRLRWLLLSCICGWHAQRTRCMKMSGEINFFLFVY